RSDPIYAGTSDGKLWRLRKQGTTWRPSALSGRAGGPPDDRYVTDLAGARADPAQLFAAFDVEDGAPLWRCAMEASASGEGECEWQPAAGAAPGALPPGPVFTVETDPQQTSVLYAGTERGVYRSTDMGRTWEDFNQGLPRTSVFDLG